MVCGCPVSPIAHPVSRLVLVGCDHLVSLDAALRTAEGISAFERTEAYEWAKRRGNARALLQGFQPFKLAYAALLADFGMKDKAMAYVSAIRQSAGLKCGGKFPEKLAPLFWRIQDREALALALDHLEERLEPTKFPDSPQTASTSPIGMQRSQPAGEDQKKDSRRGSRKGSRKRDRESKVSTREEAKSTVKQAEKLVHTQTQPKQSSVQPLSSMPTSPKASLGREDADKSQPPLGVKGPPVGDSVRSPGDTEVDASFLSAVSTLETTFIAEQKPPAMLMPTGTPPVSDAPKQMPISAARPGGNAPPVAAAAKVPDTRSVAEATAKIPVADKGPAGNAPPAGVAKMPVTPPPKSAPAKLGPSTSGKSEDKKSPSSAQSKFGKRYDVGPTRRTCPHMCLFQNAHGVSD